MSTPTRTFIYGSCVSRDTFEYLDDSFVLVDYVARQSLISAMTPPWAGDAPRPQFTSTFQQRMLRGDKNSNLLRRIRRTGADNIDLILWDITDERLGVWCGPEGSHLTRSVELLRTDAPERLSATYPLTEFGTPAHLAAWLRALHTFAGDIEALGLTAKVFPVLVPWAERNETGGRTPTSFGIDAHDFNALALPYVAAIEHYFPAAQKMTLAPHADSDHQWSEAPFHYAPAVYRDLAHTISASCQGTIGFR